jgi:hypothetical protein
MSRMGDEMKALLLGAALLAGAGSMAGQALADGLDGVAPAICATTETYDCAPDSQCIRDTPEALNLPRFIRIDFAAKKAFTTRQGGDERTAEIASQQVDDAQLILQGVQAGHGWSMVIARETGAMSLSVAGDQMGFVIFGYCTTP